MPSLLTQLYRYQVTAAYAWALVVTSSVAVVSLVVSLQLGLLVGIFALMAWWAWQNPWSAWLTLLVVAPLLPLFKITQTVGNITLLKDVLILTLFVRLFVWPLFHKQLPYRRNILFAPLLVLGIWTAVSLLQADSLVLGILRARDIILYVLVYFVALYIPLSAESAVELGRWLGAQWVVIVLLGAYQWFAAIDSAVLRFDPTRAIWIPRLSSTFAHPSVFGHYLLAASALCAAGIVILPIKRQRLWAGLGLAVNAWLIYLTYSRAVWLGLVAIIAVALVAPAVVRREYHLGPQRWRTLLTGLLVTGVLIYALLQFTSVGGLLASAFDSTYKSNSIRLDFFTRLISATDNRQALFGQGLGDVIAQNFRTTTIDSTDIASGDARTVQLAKDLTLVDNQYLKTFIEMGLAGLLIYAWIYWRVGVATVRLLRSDLWQNQWLGLASGAFLLAFMVQALFIDIWDIFPTNLYFWLIVALVSRTSLKNRA